MLKQSVFIIIAEVYIVYWWLCLAYSRHKTALARAAEKKKYGAWDAAYDKALKEDKGHYYAVTEAARVVKTGPAALKAWTETYDKAVKAGTRTYTAGVKAAAAARLAAHR